MQDLHFVMSIPCDLVVVSCIAYPSYGNIFVYAQQLYSYKDVCFIREVCDLN